MIFGTQIYFVTRNYNMLAGKEAGADRLLARFTEEKSTMRGSLGYVCELDLVPDAKLKKVQII